MSPPTLLSVPALRERGWTPSLLLRLLGEPDDLRGNPYYKNSAPMRLYAADRVEAAEQTPAFLAARKQAARRADYAKKGVETKRAALMRQAAEMTVDVEALPLPVVRRRALTALGSRTEEGPSGSGFLDRITVDYIHHALTTYDRQLEEVARRVGAQEAVRTIRRMVYAAIAAAYPRLAAECDRQRVRRGGG
ncbi:hypothetical protein [Teichococcus vastitatis]|uniref:hypothetical protein n=1 Tax=Teichococcus vastitatis TaxID=2307076 RepID=UPI000E70E98C|nr:hypothetical protein [Pseudoroseomonas vastitatis]